MPYHLAFLPLIILANQIHSDPPGAPPDPIFPLPLFKQMREPRSCVSVGLHSWLPVGCYLENGSQFVGGNYYHPFFEDDCIIHTLIAGPSPGMMSQWYLGHGVASTFTVRFPNLESSIGIEWYPIEGLDISLRFDLLAQQVKFGWEIETPEDFLELLDPIFSAYVLASWAAGNHQP